MFWPKRTKSLCILGNSFEQVQKRIVEWKEWEFFETDFLLVFENWEEGKINQCKSNVSLHASDLPNNESQNMFPFDCQFNPVHLHIAWEKIKKDRENVPECLKKMVQISNSSLIRNALCMLYVEPTVQRIGKYQIRIDISKKNLSY